MYENNKIKRGKIAFCQALPLKFAVRIFPLGRKGVKFCGERQSSIVYYLPQNEGKTTAERVGFSLQGKQKSERKSSSYLVCLSLAFLFDYRQRPILPGRFQPSTFGAKRLNFCVRNGNRWVPLAIVTGMVECVLHTHNYTAQSIDALSRSLFLRFCDQALDLLVSVSSMHYCTYTPDLSTL